MRKQHFLAAIAPGSVEETDQGIRVPALAFVAGRQTPVKGRASEKTPAQLETYTVNSNAWLDSGREIPFFESPHDLGADGYSNEKKIGKFEQFVAKPITADDIPSDKFKDLIGKTGIFTQALISRADAVAKYKKGLIKEISVGLGDMGGGPQIFEGSAVPWGAVRGAMLFGHSMLSEEGEDAEDEADEPQVFALTLEGAISEREMRSQPGDFALERLTETLSMVLRNIRATTEAELLGRNRQQLMAAAIDDFSSKIRQDLGLNTLAPVPVGETFMFVYKGKALDGIVSELKGGKGMAKMAIAELSKLAGMDEKDFTAALSPKSAEEVAAYAKIVGLIGKKMNASSEAKADAKGADAKADAPAAFAFSPEIESRFAAMQGTIEKFERRAEAAETEVAGMKLRQAVGDRYMAIKAQANRLNAAGKLSAAAYNAYFPADEQFSAAVERFSAAPTVEGAAEGTEKPTTLDDISAALNYLEKFGAAIQTGSISGQDPLAAKGAETMSAEEKADIERFLDSQGIEGEARERYMKSVGAV